MNDLIATIGRLFGQVIFWVAIAPWEQGLRVRAGKHVKRLDPGLHWRIPIIDQVVKQSVRMRAALLPTQTLSTLDGATLIVGGAVRYSIGDIEALYGSLDHAEDTIAQMAASALAALVAVANRNQLTASQVGISTSLAVAGPLAKCGLCDVSVSVTDFAFVRALRLVQDQRWHHGEPLTTKAAP